MNIIENLRLAWESLKGNRMRTALTLLGIIIGVGAVIAVMAIGRGAREAVLNEFSGFETNALQLSVSFDGAGERRVPFTEADLQYLERNLPDLEDITTAYWFTAETRVHTDTKNVTIEGGYPKYLEHFKGSMQEGRYFTGEEYHGQARVMAIGHEIAQERFGSAEAALGQTVYVNQHAFRIIGVFAKDTSVLGQMMGRGFDRSYVIPQTTALRLTGDKTFDFLFLTVKAGATAADVGQQAKELLQQRHPGAGYDVLTIEQLNEQIGEVTSILTGVIGAIAGISLLVGGVGIMNIMLVNVTERTKEIGLRKALGARPSDIRNQFLIEAIAICLGGGLIGTLLAVLPALAIGAFLAIPAPIGLDSIVLAAGFSLLVGIVFGVYPASQAAAKDPIEALRYE